jgi:hypothetical protein
LAWIAVKLCFASRRKSGMLMTLRKSIIGIFLFGLQLGVALYFNASIDLKIVVALALPTLAFILYKYVSNKYGDDRDPMP